MTIVMIVTTLLLMLTTTGRLPTFKEQGEQVNARHACHSKHNLPQARLQLSRPSGSIEHMLIDMHVQVKQAVGDNMRCVANSKFRADCLHSCIITDPLMVLHVCMYVYCLAECRKQ